MKATLITILLTLSWSSQLNGNVLSENQRGLASRIIGGESAYAGQYKFAAAINVQTSNSRFFCGGALITDQFILTAGHCVNGATVFTIQLGSHALKEEDPNRVTVATSQYFLHPEFDETTLSHDVGLIKLRLPVELSEYIEPVDYLPTIPIQVGSSLIAIGFGQINDKRPDLADYLQWVQVTTISNEECRQTYGSQVTDEMVCIGGNWHEGTCKGDSGSPLLQVVSRSEMVVVGVSSFMSAKGCDNTDPSGYTRTFPYLDWIKNTTAA